MKVSELIAALSELPPDACVIIYDNDYETGGLFVPLTTLGIIRGIPDGKDSNNVYINPW